MLKICENLKTLFEQLPQAQIRSKIKNFCAHHETNDKTVILSTENVQKSHSGPKLWAFEKKLWRKWLFFRVASFKRLLRPQILTKSKNFKNQHKAKNLKFILGFRNFD